MEPQHIYVRYVRTINPESISRGFNAFLVIALLYILASFIKSLYNRAMLIKRDMKLKGLNPWEFKNWVYTIKDQKARKKASSLDWYDLIRTIKKQNH